MGSGDELTLRFNAALKPVAEGFERDFLLLVDGWAKDADPNTAFSRSVEPLPFHGMSGYPYPATEHAARDAQSLNIRPALVFVRSIATNPTP
jgi:hypothetical protein